MKTIAMLACLLVACGGKKQEDTTPTNDMINTTPEAHEGGADMVPPEKMDEVKHDLDRKQMIVSRCLSAAMEAGEVKKGTHGKVGLEITITGNKASNVKIIHSDIEQKSVTDCVIKHVQDIEFPQMSKPYETSYTYAMEAN